MEKKDRVVKMCYGALETYFLSEFSMCVTRVTRHSEGHKVHNKKKK